jgi:hypothetical protein
MRAISTAGLILVALIGAASAQPLPSTIPGAPPTVPYGQFSGGVTINLNSGQFSTLQLTTAGRLMVDTGGSSPSAPSYVTTPALTYAAPGSASVATTSGVLAASGAYTRTLTVCTLPTSTSNVWMNAAGGTATVNSGLPVYAGGGCVGFGGSGLPLPTTAISAITDGASAQPVTLAGG